MRAIHELMAVDAHHAAMMVQAIHRGNSVRKVAKAGEVGGGGGVRPLLCLYARAGRVALTT